MTIFKKMKNHYRSILHVSLLDKLKAKKWLHLQNAPSHKSAVAITKFHELWFELMDYPPDSLAESSPQKTDIFIERGGYLFVHNYFAEKDAKYYLDGLMR